MTVARQGAWHLRRRHAVRRAVGGDLAAAPEARLRHHLARCAGCRAYYDHLSDVVAGLAHARSGMATSKAAGITTLSEGELGPVSTDPQHDGVAASAARRERARLLWTLDDAAPAAGETFAPGTSGASLVPAIAAAVARRPRAFAMALTLALAPVAGIVILRSTHRTTDPSNPEAPAGGEVTWRGAPEQAEPPAATPASLLVYAVSKDAGAAHCPSALRLVAEFPRSGEAQISRRDYIQFALGGLAATTHAVVVGVDSNGAFHQYYPRPGAPPPPPLVSPGSRPVPVGASFDVSLGHPLGRVTLYAFLTPASRAPDLHAIRSAVTAPDDSAGRAAHLAHLAYPHVGGTLVVVP